MVAPDEHQHHPVNLGRYLDAGHAMQTGVAAKMSANSPQAADETSPKHLRVGVNASMVSNTALVKLLLAKGVITEDELWKSLADEMETERDRYGRWLSDFYGKKITLG